MARPKSEEETRTTQIGVRVKPSLKIAAERAAARDSRTLSQWVEMLIKAALKGEPDE